jgi:hypothetical protein
LDESWRKSESHFCKNILSDTKNTFLKSIFYEFVAKSTYRALVRNIFYPLYSKKNLKTFSISDLIFCFRITEFIYSLEKEYFYESKSITFWSPSSGCRSGIYETTL